MLATSIPLGLALALACILSGCTLVLGMIQGGRYALRDYASAPSGPDGASVPAADGAAPPMTEGR